MKYKLQSLLITALVVVMTVIANAATITSAATGTWSAGATWVGGAAPGAGDDAVIATGHTITLDASTAAINTLTIQSGGILNAATFTLSGDITVNGSLSIANNITLTTNGNITVTGPNASVTFSGSGSRLSNAGTGKTLAISNGATFQPNSNATTLQLGCLLGNAFTWSVDNSVANTTIQYKTQGSFSLGNLPDGQAYGNLKFTSASASSATVTLANDLSIAGNLIFAATSSSANSWNFGTYKMIATGGSDSVIVANTGTGTITITGTGADLLTGFTSYNFVSPTNPTCTVNFAGANQNVVGGAYLNLTISGSGNMPLTGPATVSGTLTLTSGNLDNSINQVTVTGSTVTTGGTTSQTPLPVEMTSFTASMQNASRAILRWSTATEVNNNGFEIERRAENSSVWAKVGFVSGAGTSNSPKDYTFQDVNLSPGVYVYRLKQIDNNGAYKYSASTQVDVGVSNGLELLSNYPNPFNPETNIRFSVPENGFATLKVFNMLGQEVATLFSGIAQAGHYIPATFNAGTLASGVYFSRLDFNGKNIVQRMLLTK